MASTAMVCLAVLGAALQNVEKARTDVANATEVEQHAALLSLNAESEHYPHRRRRYEDVRDYESYEPEYERGSFDPRDDELYDGYRGSLHSSYGAHTHRSRSSEVAEIQEMKIDKLKERVAEEHEVARRALKKAHAADVQRLEALKDERDSVERVVKLEKLVKKEKQLNKALKEAVVHEKRVEQKMASRLREEEKAVKKLEGEIDELKIAAAKTSEVEAATVPDIKEPSKVTTNAAAEDDDDEADAPDAEVTEILSAQGAKKAEKKKSATDQEIEKIDSEIAALRRSQSSASGKAKVEKSAAQRVPRNLNPTVNNDVEAVNITLASSDSDSSDSEVTATSWYTSNMTILYIVIGIAATSCLVGTVSSCIYMSATKKRIYSPGFGK
uniref:Uncharacterized protein n=1 Tax=Lotharella oceanica TaxID=641309 RepID=A0A7S2TWG0_9EUKA